MAWNVDLKTSVIDDLRWFGRKASRLILGELTERLSANPLEVSKHMKSLRPNPVAERELRLFGKYRVLFSVDAEAHTAVVILVGEKRGNSLFVQGEEFTKHESRATQ